MTMLLTGIEEALVRKHRADMAEQDIAPMSFEAAIGTVLGSAEMRRDQWRYMARGGTAYNAVDELHECELDECEAMDELITEAMKIVRDREKTYTAEQAYTAMCMWEWQTADRSRIPASLKDHWSKGKGAVETRNAMLSFAYVVDEAWQFAADNFGYDSCFDWNFVPRYMEAAATLGHGYDKLSFNQVHILAAMGLS